MAGRDAPPDADVDDLFAYIDVVADTLGAHYRPLDMYLSTKLTAAASLDAGITTIIDACHSSRSPEHTDAALDALDSAGIRALHMVGAAMDKKASAAHLPRDLERLALDWNQDGGRSRSASSASSSSTGGRSRAASTCAS